MQIQLSGRSAILALAVLAVVGTVRLTMMRAELETDALEELESYLAVEYSAGDVEELSRQLAELDSGALTNESALARTERILAAQRVEFPGVTAHGAMGGGDRDFVVRVEILVDGDTPPDGDSVRYYRMRYRTLSGWKVGARTSALAYWLAIF